ncbi:hypothetical protein N473_08590 [Pseudoalteromonas luteoviolacea CPMOR-1]|uniref:Uncharacterized protein n=1 Tax=Pseudoalteromonas luteoviolacea CPMOR-1 TaxID=1365248 RepID=A0A161YUY2_9GAMM|nr:hypothetical protein N473_08590 [Pseudoalteromonas luteoviolacea CPMOR-1]
MYSNNDIKPIEPAISVIKRQDMYFGSTGLQVKR